MSVYDDMAENANKCKKLSADENNWKEGGFYWGMPLAHRITKEVENKVNSSIISESEVNSARSIARNLIQVDLLNVAARIRRVEAALGKDVVSLNGKTFQNDLEETAHSIENIYNSYMEFDNAIGERLPKVIEFQRNYQITHYFTYGEIEEYK